MWIRTNNNLLLWRHEVITTLRNQHDRSSKDRLLNAVTCCKPPAHGVSEAFAAQMNVQPGDRANLSASTLSLWWMTDSYHADWIVFHGFRYGHHSISPLGQGRYIECHNYTTFGSNNVAPFQIIPCSESSPWDGTNYVLSGTQAAVPL